MGKGLISKVHKMFMQLSIKQTNKLIKNGQAVGIWWMTWGTQTGANNLEGWGGEGHGREVQEGGDIYIYFWLIHVDVWQKPTKFCKLIFN